MTDLQLSNKHWATFLLGSHPDALDPSGASDASDGLQCTDHWQTEAGVV